METQDFDLSKPLTADQAEQLLASLIPGLHAILKYRIPDAATREDLVAETLIIISQRLQTLAAPHNIYAFAAQVARNLAISHMRRQASLDRARAPLDEAATSLRDETPDFDSTDADAAAAVAALLKELPNVRDRKLLVRYYLEDAEKEEICKELSLSEAQLNQALARARTRFRQLIKKRAPSLDRRFFG
jgi:RNA polymerase sigma-70 factor (ECF subfamily)